MNKYMQDLPEELVKGSLSLVVPLRSCCNVAILQEKTKQKQQYKVCQEVVAPHASKEKERKCYTCGEIAYVKLC